ncbi:C-X-C motif chemokine 17 isoform X2 [Octodon degus]|uniref:C-X-C motif chemokine 17 isoform X2 n=1 Tax=Octodon degus TaxID=10160 RepID=A0A6P6DJQ4_OCTDE|nr:C-X-C motif chemokine 17 isoform X2 [Octodon degus]
MKLKISFLLLLLPLMLMSSVSSSPTSGVARGRWDQRQAPRRWLSEGSQEYPFLGVLRRNLMTEPQLPKKQCPCDHVKVNVKKTRHHRRHRKPNRRSRACQEFLKQCQLASIALPL